MKKLIGQVLRLIQLLERASAVPPLLVRWGVGLMFLGGALHKATHLSEFVAYFQQLHIPAPQLQAPFVVCVEFFGGLGLMVALATAAIPDHKIHANWRGLLDFLYLPEWLLLCLLGWLIIVGAGRFSVDFVIRQKLESDTLTSERS